MVPTAAAASSACGRTLEDVLLYSELSAKYAGTAAPVGGFSPEAKLASAAFYSFAFLKSSFAKESRFSSTATMPLFSLLKRSPFAPLRFVEIRTVLLSVSM